MSGKWIVYENGQKTVYSAFRWEIPPDATHMICVKGLSPSDLPKDIADLDTLRGFVETNGGEMFIRELDRR